MATITLERAVDTPFRRLDPWVRHRPDVVENLPIVCGALRFPMSPFERSFTDVQGRKGIKILTGSGEIYEKIIEEEKPGLKRWQMRQPGGIVYARETQEGAGYWFSIPPRGMSMSQAFPAFASSLHLDIIPSDGSYFIRTNGDVKEPQLYLEADRYGRVKINCASFREPEGFKERYY